MAMKRTPRRPRRQSGAPPPETTELRPSPPAFEGAPEDELTALILRACLIARDAVFNVRDALADGSRLAFLAIKDCEKELDQIERKIDEQLPGAIKRVN